MGLFGFPTTHPQSHEAQAQNRVDLADSVALSDGLLSHLTDADRSSLDHGTRLTEASSALMHGHMPPGQTQLRALPYPNRRPRGWIFPIWFTRGVVVEIGSGVATLAVRLASWLGGQFNGRLQMPLGFVPVTGVVALEYFKRILNCNFIHIFSSQEQYLRQHLGASQGHQTFNALVANERGCDASELRRHSINSSDGATLASRLINLLGLELSLQTSRGTKAERLVTLDDNAHGLLFADRGLGQRAVDMLRRQFALDDRVRPNGTPIAGGLQQLLARWTRGCQSRPENNLGNTAKELLMGDKLSIFYEQFSAVTLAFFRIFACSKRHILSTTVERAATLKEDLEELRVSVGAEKRINQAWGLRLPLQLCPQTTHAVDQFSKVTIDFSLFNQHGDRTSEGAREVLEKAQDKLGLRDRLERMCGGPHELFAAKQKAETILQCMDKNVRINSLSYERGNDDQDIFGQAFWILPVNPGSIECKAEKGRAYSHLERITGADDNVASHDYLVVEKFKKASLTNWLPSRRHSSISTATLTYRSRNAKHHADQQRFDQLVMQTDFNFQAGCGIEAVNETTQAINDLFNSKLQPLSQKARASDRSLSVSFRLSRTHLKKGLLPRLEAGPVPDAVCQRVGLDPKEVEAFRQRVLNETSLDGKAWHVGKFVEMIGNDDDPTLTTEPGVLATTMLRVVGKDKERAPFWQRGVQAMAVIQHLAGISASNVSIDADAKMYAAPILNIHKAVDAHFKRPIIAPSSHNKAWLRLKEAHALIEHVSEARRMLAHDPLMRPQKKIDIEAQYDQALALLHKEYLGLTDATCHQRSELWRHVQMQSGHQATGASFLTRIMAPLGLTQPVWTQHDTTLWWHAYAAIMGPVLQVDADASLSAQVARHLQDSDAHAASHAQAVFVRDHALSVACAYKALQASHNPLFASAASQEQVVAGIAQEACRLGLLPTRAA